MNKDNLQKELLEKVKKGIKPSDLKKQGKTPTPASTPPPSPIITPIDKKPSKNQDKTINNPPLLSNKEIEELQNQVNFWSQTANNHLTNLQKATAENDYLKEQVKELKDNPAQLNKEIETALKEANQKIRDQEKIIEELKNQGKNTGDNKKKTFNCYHCQQSHPLFLLVIEIPEKGKLCQSCWKVLRNQTKKPTNKFTCHNCQEKKESQEYKVKLDPSNNLYSICPPCLPLIREYNEKEQDSNRELDIWE